jgi:serine/threonine protein kinase
MTEQRNRRVAELFEAALREEPAHRSEFLRRACADDESLLIEVRSLVDEDERLGHTTGASLQETASMTSHANFDASGISHIARYLVVRELGRGGMGVVFEARDPLIGRTVAIKTIRLDAFAGFSDTRSLQDLLLREARTAGALSHPGIVIIHDCGVYDNLTFITMEYIDGPTLQRKLRMERQIERSEAVNLLRQIAVALDYAHAAGVVHRDVKPGNIMLQQGRLVKITDFGIAKVSVTHQLEHTGTVVGTPAYMAPEQIRGHPVGGRTDQFSLGVVAFEMLTGVRPFRAKSLPELVHQVVYGERPSARAANPALPQLADAAFYRSLATLPGDRYGSCLEFVGELEAAINEKVALANVGQPGTPEPKVVSVDVEVKDGARMGMDNICQDDVGNPARPLKIGWEKKKHVRRYMIILAIAAVLAAGAEFGLRMLHPTPPERAPARTLTYYFQVRNPNSSEWLRYSREMIVSPGYWLRFHFAAPQLGHLYLLNEGPSPRGDMASLNTLFPSPTSNHGSSFLEANRDFQFPAGEGIKLDKEEGTEKLFVIWSGQEIPRLEALKKWTDPKQKEPNAIESADDVAAIQDFLKKHSLATARIDEENKRTVLTQTDDPLVYMIRLEHQ